MKKTLKLTKKTVKRFQLNAVRTNIKAGAMKTAIGASCPCQREMPLFSHWCPA